MMDLSDHVLFCVNFNILYVRKVLQIVAYFINVIDQPLT